jgi:hypothetical protein
VTMVGRAKTRARKSLDGTIVQGCVVGFGVNGMVWVSNAALRTGRKD